jgi:TolB-like protein/Flp pilus assembly protein TadD
MFVRGNVLRYHTVTSGRSDFSWILRGAGVNRPGVPTASTDIARGVVSDEDAVPGQGIPADNILLQLEKILKSGVFARSERMKRFLRFAVEKAVSGNGQELKEYSIALAAFDKPEGFDPRLDPIVRVEAGRLRSKLLEYYAEEGRSDPIRISMSKSSYQPTFKKSSDVAAVAIPVSPGSSPAGASEAGHAGPLYEPQPCSVMPKDTTVAVLPLADLSPSKDQGYFCDGLTEEIVSALSRARGLKVVARTSTMQFKDEAMDIRQIGRFLDAGSILEGSVRKAGERLRISAQLINVADGCHIWSEVYDRKTDDVLDIQREISSAIARALKSELVEAGLERQPKYKPRNLKAYELYLRGRHHWNKRSQEHIRKGITYLEQAVDIEPQFGLAHAGLAASYASLAWLGTPKSGEARTKIMEASRRALHHKDSASQARCSMGFVKAAFDWDWSGAEAEFQRAIQLDSQSATAYHWYAVFCLAPQLRLPEAVLEIERAEKLVPASVPIRTHHGWILYLQRRYDVALEVLRHCIELDPSCWLSHWHQGFVYEQLAMHQKAMTSFTRARELAPREPAAVGSLGRIFGILGDSRSALKALRRLKNTGGRHYISPVDIAHVHIGLGQIDSAFEWLERASEQRCGRLIHIKADPAFDRLKSEPAFLRLLERMRLGSV